MITLFLVDVREELENILTQGLQALGLERCAGLAMKYQTDANFIDLDVVDEVMRLYSIHGTSYGYISFIEDTETGYVDALTKYFNVDGETLAELTLMAELESGLQESVV